MSTHRWGDVGFSGHFVATVPEHVSDGSRGLRSPSSELVFGAVTS